MQRTAVAVVLLCTMQSGCKDTCHQYYEKTLECAVTGLDTTGIACQYKEGALDTYAELCNEALDALQKEEREAVEGCLDCLIDASPEGDECKDGKSYDWKTELSKCEGSCDDRPAWDAWNEAFLDATRNSDADFDALLDCQGAAESDS